MWGGEVLFTWSWHGVRVLTTWPAYMHLYEVTSGMGARHGRLALKAFCLSGNCCSWIQGQGHGQGHDDHHMQIKVTIRFSVRIIISRIRIIILRISLFHVLIFPLKKWWCSHEVDQSLASGPGSESCMVDVRDCRNCGEPTTCLSHVTGWKSFSRARLKHHGSQAETCSDQV